MGDVYTFILIIIGIIPLIIFITGFKIVPQSEAYVIEQLGSYYTTWNEGLHFMTPLMFRIVNKVSLKEQLQEFKTQVKTKDDVKAELDIIIHYQVTDPKLFTYGVNQPMVALKHLVTSQIKKIICEYEEKQILNNAFNDRVDMVLNELTAPWGMKINRVDTHIDAHVKN